MPLNENSWPDSDVGFSVGGGVCVWEGGGDGGLGDRISTSKDK